MIVVAYGAVDHLKAALAGLGSGHDVVVVDNGRSEGVAAACAAVEAEYVRPERNLGYAAGVNRGLAAIEPGRDVLLLNPDAVITWPNIIRLQERLRQPRAACAAVAPRLVRPDGSSERSRWPVPSPGVIWADAAGFGERVARRWFLTGAVLLLHGQALAEVGCFDERFFLYAEEADWQVRAQRAGWRIAVADDVVAEHIGGGTSPDETRRLEHFTRSGLLFARKWHGPVGASAVRAGSVLAALRRLLTGDASTRRRQLVVLRLLLRSRP